MNGEKHKAFTGQSNERILENAPKIAAGVKRLIVRVPTIPTFNDTPEEIEAIARFAKTLPGVNELHLLPYHRLGADKYKKLGRTYTLPDILPPSDAHMQHLLEVVRRVGLNGQIGG